MKRRRLTYVGVSYFDRSWGLENGDVALPGLELTFLPCVDLAGLFLEMCQDAEHQSSEMSLSNLISMVANGDDRLVAIPVFPSRSFRHSQIYVHTGSEISQPADLRGKNVGIVDYHMTAAVWVRGLLEEDYGVRADQIRWWTSEDVISAISDLRFPLPDQIELTAIPAGRSLGVMLESGELDALIAPQAPGEFEMGSPTIRRLFPNYREIEHEYFRRTGHFPIMHTVVLRRDLYEQDPWLAVALLNLFQLAKQRGVERLLDLNVLAVIHPWIGAELTEISRSFGGDPFVYGLGPNLRTIETVIDYSFRQGISKRRVDWRELFAPNTWEWAAPDDPLQERYW